MQETLHATHLLKLLDKMYKYEMDPTRTVDATEQTRDAGRTDGRTDGQMDGQSETNIAPNNFVVYNDQHGQTITSHTHMFHMNLFTRRKPESMHHRIISLFGAKPLSEPMLAYRQLDPTKHISKKFCLIITIFHLIMFMIMSSAKQRSFCLSLNVSNLSARAYH